MGMLNEFLKEASFAEVKRKAESKNVPNEYNMFLCARL